MIAQKGISVLKFKAKRKAYSIGRPPLSVVDVFYDHPSLSIVNVDSFNIFSETTGSFDAKVQIKPVQDEGTKVYEFCLLGL